MSLASIVAVDAAGLLAHIDNLTEDRVRASVLRILGANVLCSMSRALAPATGQCWPVVRLRADHR